MDTVSGSVSLLFWEIGLILLGTEWAAEYERLNPPTVDVRQDEPSGTQNGRSS